MPARAHFPRYCWSHQQSVADITDEDLTGAPDGRFDATCRLSSNLKLWHPPLPPFGWYAAEQCIEADVHQIIAETVAAIEDPAIDASQACDVTDLLIYADFVQTLAAQARDACVAHLSCNGAPAGCDIDATTPENEACTVPTAETLCDQAVLAPARSVLRFFGFDDSREAYSCVHCEQIFMGHPYFDSKWLDELEPTLQLADQVPGEAWCFVCETRPRTLGSPCEVCGAIVADETTGACVSCTTLND